MTSIQWRWIGILIVTILAGIFLYPSIDWYTLPASERQDREARRERPRWLLNLGLDLKGGTHFLMELDVPKLDVKEKLPDAMARAIEIIRNRIDQYGVAEPLIAKQGDRWVVVQLPGITNPEQAKALLGKTALLEFKMVDDSDSARKVYDVLAANAEPPYDKDGKLRADLAKVMPKGDEVVADREGRYFVLRSSSALTGASLIDARVDTMSGMGFPNVNFKLNAQGARTFDALTAANIGKNLAIILDNIVYTAPTIKSRISGGSGQIEGQFSMDEARNLAIVLRAGALPAPVNVIEERTVGPGLGEDSIRKGVIATVAGLLLIFLFMGTYYRIAGWVANLALTLNLFYLLAGMAYFKATLTLPGIAGVVLTMGMAVDANVLIFERLREELRNGKPVRLALDTAYDKAFSAILDAHVTELISGVFLFQFGTGPIKGFAVTLTMGIIISLFTSIVVTRVVFDSYMSSSPNPRISV
jgi:preprotein translocase subunit SecD